MADLTGEHDIQDVNIIGSDGSSIAEITPSGSLIIHLIDEYSNIINPAKEDGNLNTIRTATDKLQFDISNNLKIVTVKAGGSIPIQLARTGITTPVESFQWQDLINYTVPTGYTFNAAIFKMISSQAGDQARAIYRNSFGTHDSPTDVFTQGYVCTLPRFAAMLNVLVTTAIGGISDQTFTITYTNQDGTTGRTATVDVDKNTVVGNRFEVVLQTGDYGVVAVTNVTRTINQAGVITIEGLCEELFLDSKVADDLISEIVAPNSVVVEADSSLIIQYNSPAAGPKDRKVSLVGTLVPE